MTGEAKEIELRFSDREPRRYWLAKPYTFLRVPTHWGSYLEFAFSGQRTADGIEVWTEVNRH